MAQPAAEQWLTRARNDGSHRAHYAHYRHDTEPELRVLNRFWRLVNDRFNYLTPTKKPIGFASDVNGKRKCLYDTPKTPPRRLLAAHVLPPEKQAELLAYRDSLNPAAIGRQIAELQVMLLKLAKDKTEQLYLALFRSALPDIRKGIRVKAS